MNATPSKPATKLGALLSNGNGKTEASLPAASPLGRLIANGRRGENVTLPFFGEVRIELVGATAAQEVEAAVHKRMGERGVDPSGYTSDRFELERAVQTLALAVLDPITKQPFGTVAEWGDLDSALVNIAWQAHGDVYERLDPLATPLTDDEKSAIEAAVKKKDAALLRTFGCVRLSLWLATTDAPPSTSPTPRSSSSESELGS